MYRMTFSIIMLVLFFGFWIGLFTMTMWLFATSAVLLAIGSMWLAWSER
jgi:hypothetical protein